MGLLTMLSLLFVPVHLLNARRETLEAALAQADAELYSIAEHDGSGSDADFRGQLAE